jgi:hypothetical protein
MRRPHVIPLKLGVGVIFGNLVPSTQEGQFVPVTKTALIMLSSEIIALLRITWNVNTLCRQNYQFLNVAASGTYS